MRSSKAAFARRKRVALKESRSYTLASHDIHERNQPFLEVVAEQYRWLCANEPGWYRLPVCDNEGNMLAREVTQQNIINLLGERDLLK